MNQLTERWEWVERKLVEASGPVFSVVRAEHHPDAQIGLLRWSGKKRLCVLVEGESEWRLAVQMSVLLKVHYAKSLMPLRKQIELDLQQLKDGLPEAINQINRVLLYDGSPVE